MAKKKQSKRSTHRITAANLHSYPEHIQEQIITRYPEWGTVKPRKGKGEDCPPPAPLPPREALPDAGERLELWFPGLMLPTLNVALGGKVVDGKRKSPIRIRTTSRRVIKRFVTGGHFEATPGLSQFRGCRVDLAITQSWGQKDARLYDSGNVFSKSLIDVLCLPSRRRGQNHYLGIIEDDRPEFVRRVTSESQRGLRTGVLVVITRVQETKKGIEK